MTGEREAWRALWALVIGFFMILIDTTIVTVANPSIQQGLQTSTDAVIWVTSAYLLAYAVPLLITGRLGDRYGPKRIYLVGLVVFTISSLFCGLADVLPGSGISNLIAARAAQGIGAALMTPQTMAVITRTFPAAKRGGAMALWGAVAGVASLLGPLLGGVLVDGPGWEWIFFVNLPVGVIAFIAAKALVPDLDTHAHSFDWLGVTLSGIGMFGLVFGIQEGQSHNWAGWIWGFIGGGLLLLVLFVMTQGRGGREPLLPLKLFKDRNFSLANATISAVGFMVTSAFIPIAYYFQLVLGLSPTQSALMTAPSAVATIVLARFAGKLTDAVHPRYLVVPATLLVSVSLILYSVLMKPGASVISLLIPSLILGIGSAFMWGPISSTATRNLPLRDSGAGAGVFNTTRQIGSVLGSAAVATLIASRLVAELPGGFGGGQGQGGGLQLPAQLQDGFAAAMSQTLFLPAAVVLAGTVAAAFFVRPVHMMAPKAEVDQPIVSA